MTDCFHCADPANYAAVALKLQSTAIEAENCIFALEQRLRGAVNQPTLISTVSGAGLPVDQSFVLTTSSAVFQNSAFASFANRIPRGVYQVGLSFTITATGVVNDNTYRFAFITVRNFFAASNVPNKFVQFDTAFESSSGNGMDMGLHTVIESDGNDVVQFSAQHGNTSSTCNVTNGLAWISRLSDLDAPRVVI